MTTEDSSSVSEEQNDECVQGTKAVKKLTEKFKNSILNIEIFRDESQVLVKRDDLFSIMKFLKDDEELSYECLVNLTAVDRSELDDNHRFEMVYHLHSYSKRDRLCIKAPVEENDCSVQSMVSLWKSAEMQEREVYDLYGVLFANHPDLRRLFLWEGFDGHPLRKDYPLKGRGEREIFSDEYYDNIG